MNEWMNTMRMLNNGKVASVDGVTGLQLKYECGLFGIKLLLLWLILSMPQFEELCYSSPIQMESKFKKYKGISLLTLPTKVFS